VFVLAGCIVYVLAVVVSFIVVFLYCICALCNVCYLSVVLLYYCHRVKAQLQFNKYVIYNKDKNTHNHIDYILIDRRRHSSVLDV
jgi:hypothetical protein